MIRSEPDRVNDSRKDDPAGGVFSAGLLSIPD